MGRSFARSIRLGAANTGASWYWNDGMFRSRILVLGCAAIWAGEWLLGPPVRPASATET